MDVARRAESQSPAPDRTPAPDRSGPVGMPPGRRRLWRWLLGIPLVLLLLIGVAIAFIDEPLRGYAERELNRRVDGYTFRIGALHFHPIGLSLDLEDVTVAQKEHSDPPIAQLKKWPTSI